MCDRNASEKCHTGSTFQLLDLGDDCLMAVLQHLRLADLSSIASTCGRLLCIARAAFALTDSNKCLSISHRHTFHSNTNGEIRVAIGKLLLYTKSRPIAINAFRQNRRFGDEVVTRQYLRNFGDLFHEINFDYQFWVLHTSATTYNIAYHVFPNQQLFETLLRRCGATLCRLRVAQIEWTSELARQARPLIGRLTKLHAVNCSHLERILLSCGQCEDLSIEGQISCEMLRQDFNHLSRLALIDHRLGHGVATEDAPGNCGCYERFVARHRHVRYLEIGIPIGFNLMIISRFSQLKELHLRGSLFALSGSASMIGQTQAAGWHWRHRLIRRLRNAAKRVGDPVRRAMRRMGQGWRGHRSTPLSSHQASSAFQLSHLKRISLDGEMHGASELVSALAAAAPGSLEQLRICNGTLNSAAIMSLNRLDRLQSLELVFIRYSPHDAFKSFGNFRRLDKLTLHFDAEQTMRMSDIASDTWSSLRYLNLKNVIVDLQFLQTLRRQPLHQLQLSQVQLMDIDDEEMRSMLRSLNAVQEFRLIECEPPVNRKWLMHLGATFTMQRIAIDSCCIDSTLVEGLSRYRGLRTLELCDARCIDVGVRGEALRHLNSIENLLLKNVPLEISDFLCHLGSAGTLRHLTVHLSSVDARFMQTIRQLRRLRTLQIEDAEKITNANIATFDHPELRELSLVDGAYGDFTWPGVLEMIGRLPEIRLLKLKSFYKRNPLNLATFNRLLEVCCARRRKLFMELQQYEPIDAPPFLYANDNCKFLEIRFVVKDK